MKVRPDVTVVIPSYGRPEQLRECIEQLLTTAPDAEVIVTYDQADTDTLEVAKSFGVVRTVKQERIGNEWRWNIGAQAATGKNLVLGADDLWFTDGWYEAALEAMAKINNYGMVGFNDLSPQHSHPDGLAPHYMVSRIYAANEWGGVLACPHYGGYWLDMEATVRAKRDKRYAWAEDAIVEHRHHFWGKAERDETYTRIADWDGPDRAMYEDREKRGFPNDYPPVFRVIDETPEGWGKVSVGVRVYKTPDPDFFTSWTRMIGGGLRPGDRVFEPVVGMPGHHAANWLARALLASDCDSMLFVDDDMVFDQQALNMLRSNKDTFDYDVVFGFCTHKTVPPHAVVMRLMDKQPTLPVSLYGESYGTLSDIEDGSIVEVDAVGLAFTLIKRHVFEAMLGEHGALYTSWFNWGEHTEGEDIRFSRKCREHGFKLAVDTNVKIGHVGRYTYTWNDHQRLTQEINNG